MVQTTPIACRQAFHMVQTTPIARRQAFRVVPHPQSG